MNSRHLLKITCLACALLLTGMASAWAEKTAEGAAKKESIKKIHIQADHMLLNIATGNSVYTGNVRISQGDLVLTGDKVTVKQGQDEIERITVTGKPARYNHVTETGENIKASSEHMVYTASQHQLVMTINARLQQPEHQVSSEKIIYDTEKKLIIAGSRKGGGKEDKKSNDKQRVKITLTPKKHPPEKQVNP